MPAPRKVLEAVGAPVVWGILCGFALDWSAPVYIAGLVIGILGGVLGGAQHRQASQALLRGFVGGTLFGLSILLGFELSGGEEADPELPDPAILLLVLTTGPALPLHWLGWRWRSRLPSGPPENP
jgi:hypothetical protein